MKTLNFIKNMKILNFIKNMKVVNFIKNMKILNFIKNMKILNFIKNMKILHFTGTLQEGYFQKARILMLNLRAHMVFHPQKPLKYPPLNCSFIRENPMPKKINRTVLTGQSRIAWSCSQFACANHFLALLYIKIWTVTCTFFHYCYRSFLKKLFKYIAQNSNFIYT